MAKPKVAVFGAGHVGATTAQRIIEQELADVVLLDISLPDVNGLEVLRQLKQEGKPVPLSYQNVICVSDYVRRRLTSAGLIPNNAVVIHNGIDLFFFTSQRPPRTFAHATKLLYAGRLEADKGIHHIIEALGKVRQKAEAAEVSLTIVGDGELDYIAHCQILIEKLELSTCVTLLPPVPRDKMPALLDTYDILILPSKLEALSRMMQEAMAMGLLVIGTTTGGSGELLVHEQTGLVFEAANAHSLAQQLQRAFHEPKLSARLAQTGQARVCREFSIDQTINKVEAYLQGLVEK